MKSLYLEILQSILYLYARIVVHLKEMIFSIKGSVDQRYDITVIMPVQIPTMVSIV